MKYEEIKRTIASICAVITVFSSATLTGCKKKIDVKDEIKYDIEELTKDKNEYDADELSFIKFKLDLDKDQNSYYHIIKKIIDDEIDDIDFANKLFNGIIEINGKKFTKQNLKYKVYDFVVFEHELYTNIEFHGYYDENKEEKEIKINMDIYQSKESNVKIYTVKTRIKNIKTNKIEDMREFSIIYSLEDNKTLSCRDGIAFTTTITPFRAIVDDGEKYSFEDLVILESELTKINNKEVKSL